MDSFDGGASENGLARAIPAIARDSQIGDENPGCNDASEPERREGVVRTHRPHWTDSLGLHGVRRVIAEHNAAIDAARSGGATGR